MKTCDKCGELYIDAAKHEAMCAANPKVMARGMEELCDVCGARYWTGDGHTCPPRVEAPNVVIRSEREAKLIDEVNREIREAATDIVEGRAGRDVPTDEFLRYGETQTMAHNPRVLAALERLEREMEAPRNTQELVEKSCMYHEMNERAAKANQWDGQGRWIGKENEEMRKGQILSPFQFMQRLLAVIGTGKLELNAFAVAGRVAVLAPDPDWKPTPIRSKTDQKIDLLQRMESELDTKIDLRDQVKVLERTIAGMEALEKGTVNLDHLRGKKQVATLQYPLGTEWMIMRFDDYGVPTTAKFLGWRTALLTLIKLGVITEKQAHSAFPLGDGPASQWYRAQLFSYRNSGARAS